MDRADIELQDALDALPDVRSLGKVAGVNDKFVLTAAAVRSAMYVLLAGVGIYLKAVSNGDSQSHAIYTGLGAAVAAAVVRLGFEGGYDAIRAKNGKVQNSDVGAFSDPMHA